MQMHLVTIAPHDPLRVAGDTRAHWGELLLRPDLPLETLPAPSAEQARRIARAASGAKRAVEGETVHRHIAGVAQAHPAQIAIDDGEQTLSYAELDARANQLARHLLQRGVAPEFRVGLLLPRSSALVVAALAVLKAGAAFVPLDPTYPAQRLAFMVQDSAMQLLIANSSADFNELHGDFNSVCLQEEAELISRIDDSPVDVSIADRQAAYVIYTSGSTGLPKGVVLEHRGLLNLIRVQRDFFRLSQRSRVFQFAPSSFDAFVWELVMALGNAATLCIPALEDLNDGHRLLLALQRSDATIVTLPPSVLQALPGSDLPQLRSLVVAGEACSPELASRFSHIDQFVNAYGPTETTVCANLLLCDPARLPPLLGAPLDNLQVFVLDPELNLLPPGVPGEIYVAGIALARGYLDQPHLTAERFLPSPFGPPGERLYRTGDRAKLLPSGLIDFLGRSDSQVKIRGHRIELAEVERHIASLLPGGHCFVAKSGHLLDAKLTAYFKPLTDISPQDLRAQLRSLIPDYMLPAELLRLQSWPLLPNGKLDKEALLRSAPAEHARIPLSTPSEVRIAGIVQRLLDVEGVGADDSFFALVGHSLLAGRLVGQIADELGVDLALRDVFDRPSIAELAALSDARGRARSPGHAPIVPVSRAEPLPLSLAQRRLWVIERLEPGKSTYNLPFAVRLRGDFDLAAFQGALDALVARHEALRTSFVEIDGEGWQRVLAVADVRVERRELDCSEEAQDAALARFVEAYANQPFELERAPLLRVTYIPLGVGDSALAVVMHHLISDAWSMDLLLSELAQLYATLRAGQPCDRTPQPLQYVDFACWQRHALRDELERQRAYWRRILSPLPEPLALPRLGTIRRGTSAQAGHAAFEIDEASTSALLSLALRNGVTLHMLLVSVLDILLARYTSQTDICIGTPVAGRRRREAHGLVGFFVNTLPLRVNLADNPSFTQLLSRVRQISLDAYDNEDIPFETLIEELGRGLSQERPPLLQVVFAFQADAARAIEFSGVELQPLACTPATAKFELTWAASQRDGRLAIVIEYAAQAFESETIAGMARGFQSLCEAALRAPEKPVLDLDLPTDTRREDGTGSTPPLPFAHEAFLARARLTPDAIALEHAGTAHRYAAIERRSAALANRLRRLGAGPEVRVAVACARGPELIIALLAVLRSGAAYLPLDPDHPVERTRFMLEDCGVQLVVSDGACDARALGVTLVPSRAEEDDSAVAIASPDLDPANVAYVIYTSGSVGQPKGVEISHAGLAHIVRTWGAVFGVSAHSRVLSYASATFDASVPEIFSTLAIGGAICSPSSELSRAGSGLFEYLRDNAVSVAVLPPTVLSSMPHGELPDLEVLAVAGEATTTDVISDWQSGRRLLNAYGPTEASVCVTVAECGPETAPPCIGRPLPGCAIHLLDDELRPVPAGAVGELCIEGIGLARGYHGAPELTAQKFVPNPFAAPGSRLYRTGDRARLRADGQLYFVGRADRQVKLRGLRIELGEIERCLRGAPGVRDAAVLLDESSKQLLGFYTEASGAQSLEAPSQPDHYLRRHLPEYMVPTALLRLAELPLTDRGKRDVARLRELAGAQHRPQRVAPRTDKEQLLADIWKTTLKVDSIGVHDSFFALGGDSISSIQVASHARRAGLDLQPNQLFQFPTLAELAGAARPLAHAATVHRLEPGNFGLSPVQHWLLDRDAPTPHHFNMTAFFEVKQPVDVGALQSATRALVLHHDALRLRFCESAQGWAQRYSEDSGEIFKHLRIIDDEHNWTGLLASALDSLHASLDIEHGPLARVVFVDAGPGRRQRLLLLAHHLVVDVVSLHLLLEDLQSLYEQIRAGQPAHLPPKSVAFSQWVGYLKHHADSPALLNERAYWAERGGALAGLPRDGEGRNTVGRQRFVVNALDSVKTERLLGACCRRYRAKIQELLLSGLVAAVNRWTGAEGLVLEVEAHGRESLGDAIDTTRTVGWFTALYPLTLRGINGLTAPELLGSVKRAWRGVPNHGLGFGLLRHMTSRAEVRQALAALEQPELLFEYVGQTQQGASTEASGLAVAPEPPGAGQAPNMTRLHTLHVSWALVSDELVCRLTYSPNLHRSATIQALAERMTTALEELIAGTLEPEAAWVESDFPYANLERDELTDVQSRLRGREPEDLYPLTATQEGILFHCLTDSLPGVYCPRTLFAIRGSVDATRLESALAQTVAKYAALRTGFSWQGARRPLQFVERNARAELAHCSLQNSSPSEQQRALDRHLQAEGARGFDLERPSLFRATLFQLGEEDFRLCVCCHHLILDGWSLAQVFADWIQFYNAPDREQGTPSPSFGAFVAKARTFQADAASAFWRDYLGPTAPTRLEPWIGARSGERGVEALSATVPERTATRLRSVGQSQGLTAAMLLQAAWGLLLHLYTGAEAVLFGTTHSGRGAGTGDELALVGMCIHTLPTRVAFAHGQTMREFMANFGAAQRKVSTWELTPLSAIQSAAEFAQHREGFESVLVVENYPVDEAIARSLASFDIRVEHSVDDTNYPLVLVASLGARIELELKFDRHRFSADVLRMTLEDFTIALDLLLENPGSDLHQVRQRFADRQARLLEPSHGEQRPVRLDFMQLELQRLARRTPNATALVFGEERLTHAELDSRAERLAAHLQARGLRPGACVGILLERSSSLVIAALAVLKAGAAYVPLDPAYPIDRLRFMHADAKLSAVLSSARHRERLTAIGAELLDVDGLLACEPPRRNPPRLDADSLGYVLYTSGSTGTPKGVAVTHGGLSNYLSWAGERYGIEALAGSAVHSPIGFDLTVTSLWLPLLAGKCVDLMPDPGGFEALSAALAAHAAPHLLKLTPAHLSVLSHDLTSDIAPGWSGSLVVGGEALRLESIRAWRQLRPAPRIFNEYGPTEAVVGCAVHEITDADPSHREASIGRAVPNTRIYVLDRNLELSPRGVFGELCVAGAQLARGYWQRPDLTAERFVPDPFGPPGARLYRTGDRARYLADGSLQFGGRLDHQVKVRGHRVELGEIEQALCRIPEVAQAVAVVRDARGSEHNQVVAYVCLKPAAVATSESVLNDLRKWLPEFMLPARLQVLAELPTNQHGKVDRAALPLSALLDRPSHVPPESPEQRTLATLIEGLLGIEGVGLHDGFSALGGDSLGVLQLAARARSAGLDLSPRQIVESQTVERMAQIASRKATAPTANDESDGPAPLLPQQRAFFELQSEPPTHYNMTALLEVRQRIDLATLGKLWRRIDAEHDAFRARFERSNGGWSQHFVAPGSSATPVEETQLRVERPSDELQALGELVDRCQKQLDLARGPLARVLLIERGPDRSQRLLFVAHHLIADGVSLAVLLGELRQLDPRAESPTRPRSGSLQAWAKLLQKEAESPRVLAESDYWTAAEHADVRPIPGDRAGRNRVEDTRNVSLTLDSKLTGRLLADPNGRPAAHELALYSFARAIERWSGQHHVLIDVASHGRGDLGQHFNVEQLVGRLATRYPLLLKLPPAGSRRAAREVCERTIQAVPRGGIGYGLLRYMTGDSTAARRLAAAPAAEVGFNYLGRLDGVLQAGGWLAPAPEAVGQGALDPRALRPRLLDLNVSSRAGEVTLSLSYSRCVHDDATMQRLVQATADILSACVRSENE